jgi:hypothetical protein
VDKEGAVVSESCTGVNALPICVVKIPPKPPSTAKGRMDEKINFLKKIIFFSYHECVAGGAEN